MGRDGECPFGSQIASKVHPPAGEPVAGEEDARHTEAAWADE